MKTCSSYSRKQYFTLVILLMLPIVAICQIDKTSPNIIFIITDDQQKGLLGIEGSELSVTPNIDRIGKEGVIFKNAFVTTPLCSPSRASFLTGNYAIKHNVVNNDNLGLDVTSHTLLTWPRQLRESGYETAFIGKWHMGLDDSRRPGFDRWFSFKGQGAYVDGVVNDEGKRLQTSGNMTDIINKQALNYLKAEHSRKPFAMIVSHKALHWPLIPNKKNESLYPEFEFDSIIANESDRNGKPLLTRPFEQQPLYAIENAVPEMPESRRGRGRDYTSVVADQYRCLTTVDDGVGELFKMLEEQNQLANTIIIYVSDNGMLMGEHGEFNQKRWAYDPVIGIPMLIRYPKLIEKGTVKDQLVLNIDIAPTLLEITGVQSLEPMQGTSLVPILENDAAPWRNAFVAEYILEKVAQKFRPWRALRTKEWKYIKYEEENIPDELYHLKTDPNELKNLINEPSAQADLKLLKAQLTEKLKAIK